MKHIIKQLREAWNAAPKDDWIERHGELGNVHIAKQEDMDASKHVLIAIKSNMPTEKTINKITISGIENTGIISDGYHTFDELYDHRITLFIALCRQLKMEASFGETIIPGMMVGIEKVHKIWRSHKHHDGSVWDGWFIMGIGKEKGKQISYHLPLSRWEETGFAETLERAPEWDGHTSQDVLNRLKSL
jgi:hypothetical protein